MSSRETILAALRSSQIAESRLPEYAFGGSSAEVATRFLETFESVAGKYFRVSDVDAVNAKLAGLECYAGARKIASLVPGIGSPNVDVERIEDVHDLKDLDVAILEASLGVAENGAVWLDDRALGRHRAIFVIPQHLILVLRASQIVPTLHEAYERIRITPNSFGVFVSGPSKTADIEQTLVIGAHGARSCTLFFLD